ncbi:MAG TPA: PIG-L deacetylase family protein [Actinomycetota bacterium]|nr:PIG-L deacetylase family protein [Actinomycetota bacterium]
MGFASALVLFAHPDDAEFSCGGTVARWAREGCEVHYVCVTDGSAGSNDPGTTRQAMREIRARELRAAADVLGVASVTFLGEVDGFLEVTPETRRKVTREVRRLRPDVIVAPDPSRLWVGTRYVNHADHKAAGALALSAVMPDAPTRVMFQELEEEGIEPFEVPNLYLVTNEPDTYVDITDTFDVKIKALHAHASQLGPGMEERVAERARALGDLAGCRYAEGFRAFRFLDHVGPGGSRSGGEQRERTPGERG